MKEIGSETNTKVGSLPQQLQGIDLPWHAIELVIFTIQPLQETHLLRPRFSTKPIQVDSVRFGEKTVMEIEKHQHGLT